jgi:hypothetical protein
MDRRSLVAGLIALVLIGCTVMIVESQSDVRKLPDELSPGEVRSVVVSTARVMGVELDTASLKVVPDSIGDIDTLKWTVWAKSVQGDSYWCFVGTRAAGVSMFENLTLAKPESIALHEPGLVAANSDQEARRFIVPIAEELAGGRSLRIKSLQNLAGTESTRASIEAVFEYVVEGYPFVDRNPTLILQFVSPERKLYRMYNHRVIPEVLPAAPSISETEARAAASKRIGLANSAAPGFSASLGWAVPEKSRKAILCWRISDEQRVCNAYVNATSGRVVKYVLSPKR